MPRLHPLTGLFAAALFLGAALAGCDSVTGADELPPSGNGTPISFSTTGVARTKATGSGELTTANLTSMGVFASYTGSSDWATSNTCNFMHNQEVGKSGSSWTYTPVKYWPNTEGEKVSFFAYAPYSGNVTGLTLSGNAATGYPVLDYTVPVAEADQTDLLVATPLLNRTRSGGNPSFTMKHVLTCVLFKVKCTDAIKITALKVSGCKKQGRQTFTTSGSSWSGISGTQDVTATAGKDISANADAAQVAQFFLLPDGSAAKTVTVTYKESTSAAETKIVSLPTNLAWTQGKTIAYTLNIEVKSEITVTSSESGLWANGGNTNVTSTNKTITSGYAASDLKFGDYYYSDGTTSDGGYRKYTDGTTATRGIMPVLTGANGKARTVLGIVMKAGKDASGDWKDDCDYGNMSTIRGYVLALYDANGGNKCTWGPLGTQVDKTYMNREQYTGFYGYKNTKAIIWFNNNVNTLQAKFPATYRATTDYEKKYPSPTDSSGWFLPSAGQCKYWMNNKDVLLKQVKKATGDDTYAWKDKYYSSSEWESTTWGHVWSLYINGGDIYADLKNNTYWVRSVLAF